MRSEQSIFEIWRGDPWPREIILLDNDFFGQRDWRRRIKEIREGGFKVSFNQGINVRFITEEAAAALASIEYRDDGMKVKRLYTAWDNKKDEERLFKGLARLTGAGIKAKDIMVYMLIGFWPGETDKDWEYRRQKLRDFGATRTRCHSSEQERLLGSKGFVSATTTSGLNGNCLKMRPFDRKDYT
jgi:hypothetical protein